MKLLGISTAAIAAWDIFATLTGHPLRPWEQIAAYFALACWSCTTVIFHGLWRRQQGPPPG